MTDYGGYDGGYGGYGGYGSTSPLPPQPPVPPVPPRPPRRRAGLLSYVGVALAAGALGAGTVVALYHPAASSAPAAQAQPSSGVFTPAPLPSTAVPTPSLGGAAPSGGLAGVKQGVVIINTTLQYSSEQAAGTGMVINAAEGLVLTNNHVIEGATKITATVPATGQNFTAKVLGYDLTGDIALIQLQNPSGLHAVSFGNSAKVRIGDNVTALGNAEGRSAIVAAAGQVTGLNQTITASDQGGTVKQETLHGMIQTNADIVAGDSGGPLVNANGLVIGMDTAGNDVRFPDQQAAAGFAIPINTALSVARQIAAGRASSTVTIGYPPFIGIYIAQGNSASPQVQAQQEQQQNNNNNGFGNGGQSCYTSDANLGVPTSIAPVSSGTLIVGIICGSPAQGAGMTAGSVITAIDGHPVGAPPTLAAQVAKFHPGETISVTWVSPSGQHQVSNLTLKAGPPL